MRKTKKNKGGRPPMATKDKLSEVVGFRFKPADAARIYKAREADPAFTERIREAVLQEAAKALGDAGPKPRPRKRKKSN